MNNKFGLTDLVLTLLFPEVALLEKTIAKLGITRLGKRQMTKFSRTALNNLPKLSLSRKELEKLQGIITDLLAPNATIDAARETFLTDPGQLGQRLGTLTKEEKRELSRQFAEVYDIGQPDASKLSSSAVSFGIYTPTSQASGNLELTFIKGGTYTYPGVPAPIWEEMKAATGKNGSGAYTIFYYGYWRAASGTKGARQISTAFRLAGIGR